MDIDRHRNKYKIPINTKYVNVFKTKKKKTKQFQNGYENKEIVYTWSLYTIAF